MSSALITDLLSTLDELSGGVHSGFRPAHAKGLMCIGTFRPSPEAAGLTRAPHATRPSTPVTVRYIEVAAAANAAVGDKADVNVLGTATAAGNQQNASPNFTVRVVKK